MKFDVNEGIEILRRTPSVLREFLLDLPDVWVMKNEGEGTWSPYDVVGHLIHGEKVDWIERMNIILGGGEWPTFRKFDRFAQFRESKDKDLRQLLDEFADARAQNIRYLEGIVLTDADLDRKAIHPSFGLVTLRQLLSTWVAHDLDHIVQISRTMARQYADEAGPWRAYLSVLQPRNKAEVEMFGEELIEMAAEDQRVRMKLANDESLHDGYHPRMREIHAVHAKRLSEIIDTIGWPRRSFVGEEAAEAAWLILQHAIDNPELQRRGLTLMKEAVAINEASAVHAAMLHDRICVHEGLPQRYGTQFDWDEEGKLSPYTIDDPDDVDQRRSEVGLPPLSQQIARLREDALAANEQPPTNWKQRQKERDEWLRSVGWRS